MALATLLSVEEYLSTIYHPDREYVDGEVVERNMGESEHSRSQMGTAGRLFAMEASHGVHVFPEFRLQTGPRRFRVPDILVTTQKIRGRILREPPFLCVEILSPEDRFSRVEMKILEYLEFGVPYVWLIDPRQRKAWSYTREGRRDAVETLSTSGPALSLRLSDIFASLDDSIEAE